MMFTAAVRRKRSEKSTTRKPEAIDRISDLPEHIIHKILTRLPNKDASRTSSLSKRFRLAWNSFPIIDFDDTYGGNCLDDTRREQFLNFMHGSILRRAPNISLEKFRLHVELDDTESDNRIDGAIGFAIEKKVKELDLDVRSLRNAFGFFYNLPSVLFAVNSIVVLKLEGFNLGTLDLTKFPSIEKLSLKNCNGFKNLEVSSAQLQTIEAESCTGLLKIDIRNSNLRSFSFKGKKSGGEIEACQINLADCKSLNNLVLKRTIINCEWFKNHVPKFLLLENLTLSGCHKLRQICIRNPRLKGSEIISCTRLERIEIVVPNLESFVFCGEFKQCEIKITACKSLRNLELYRANVTNSWVNKNVSEFPFLVNLRLVQCEKLEKLEISHQQLKSFQLVRCIKLVKAEICARKLVSFRYHGEVTHSPPLIDSPGLEAELTLVFDSQRTTSKWYKELRNFLGYFDHCKLLTLDCTLEKIFIFPEDLRESLLPPLFDIKHLKVKMNSSPGDLVRLVDSMLWLSPLLETLSIIVSDAGEKSLKFQYANPAFVDEEDDLCCSLRIIKCWRHYMNKVSMENFHDNDDKKRLAEFFASEAMRLETIVAT